LLGPVASKRRGVSEADVVLQFLLDAEGPAGVARTFGVTPGTVGRWRREGVPARRADEARAAYSHSSASDSIEAAMADVKKCAFEHFGGYPDERTHNNKDGSIDAQLTVYEIPRGMAVTALITDLAECARALSNTFGTFVQVGMRWGATGDGPAPTSGDRRYRGLAEGSTFYYAAENLGRVFVHALDIAKNVAAKSRRRKIETVFVRVHWNPQGVAPKSWNPKKLVYRVYKRKRARKDGDE